jgi:hypothetical protein
MTTGRNGEPPGSLEVGARPGLSSRTEATDDTTQANGHHTADTAQGTSPAVGKPGTALLWVPCTRPPAPQDIESQLERRRQASKRSMPLPCGCRDLWTCRCADSDEVSERMVDAAVAALGHLDQCGLPGIFDIRTCRSLWRHGHRQLAAEVAARGGWSA